MVVNGPRLVFGVALELAMFACFLGLSTGNLFVHVAFGPSK